ncbi:hypothetical protein WISP_118697 [Willisornis vidua]|uniref:Uncharacterized protein n=1 Tax=Willisornis vidua TaxID=1566151 RepID=A0ABQ9CT66_9PASS|nr:hypothetical protein WISP_118697 [Willisornis vidua]
MCTLSTTSPPTHLIDQVLMRGHPLVPLWSVWRSCSRAVQVSQEDEREEVEGSANPWQGGEPAWPIRANCMSAVEIGTPQVGLSCPELAVTTHSSQLKENSPAVELPPTNTEVDQIVMVSMVWFRILAILLLLICNANCGKDKLDFWKVAERDIPQVIRIVNIF